MEKPIPTSIHGVLDYTSAATFFALPRMLGWPADATALATGVGVAVLGSSLLTKYELGLFKVLPMKAHLMLDAGSGVVLLGAALALRKHGPSVAGGLAAMGLLDIIAPLLTQTTSPIEQREHAMALV